MDVLFGSIDLTDLLPATSAGRDSTHHESITLSAPDLRLLLHRLQVRSLHIKDRVRDQLTSDRATFSSLFSRTDDVISSSEAVSRLLFDAISSLSGEDSPAETANELAEKRRKLKEQKNALTVVHGIAVLYGRLDSVRICFKEFRFVQAAEMLRGLKDALLIPNGEVEDHVEKVGDPVVYGLLRKQWYVCFDEVGF